MVCSVGEVVTTMRETNNHNHLCQGLDNSLDRLKSTIMMAPPIVRPFVMPCFVGNTVNDINMLNGTIGLQH